MRNLFPVCCFTLILFIACSCTFYNEKDYFNLTYNTEGLTYDSVSYIFDNNCVRCHSVDYTERDEIKLDNYQNVVNSINTGKVLPAIKHEGPYLMPNGEPKLPDFEINRIEAWANDGMPE